MRILARITIAATAALTVASARPAAAQQVSADSIKKEAQSWVQAFYDGNLDRMWPRLSGAFKAAVGSLENFLATREQMLAQLGTQKSVVSEEMGKAPQCDVFTRVATFEKMPGELLVQLVFDRDSIYGFGIRPKPGLAPSDYLDYTTKTELHFPFAEDSYIFWGGRTLEQNYHAQARDQRFAYDIMVRKNGSSHDGDGSRAEQYYCWGRPILAPAAGAVVEAVDSLPDMTPGEMNPRQPLGNHVILDHGDGEYSFLAHMQKGSVRVHDGEKVTSSTVLGGCGNSGNTSEPHLHYHLQDSPVFGQGAGMPAQFVDYIADGKHVDRGEPVKGQTVRREVH
jgi:Peptidase family M23